MRKICAGDSVVVISGKDKGKTGTVLRVLSEIQRVVVADVNMRTRHVPKNANRAGQILRYEASIHWSNIMLVDPKTKKRTRVGFAKNDKGVLTRIARKSGAPIAATKAIPAKKKPEQSPTESAKAPAASKRGPFWKKIGFGAGEMEARAEVEGTPHMKEDHSVPDQLERQTGRSHSRGS